jgi:hypothetical protein
LFLFVGAVDPARVGQPGRLRRLADEQLGGVVEAAGEPFDHPLGAVHSTSVYGMKLTVNDAGQGNGAQRRSTNENGEKAKHCPGLWNTAQLLPPPDG